MPAPGKAQPRHSPTPIVELAAAIARDHVKRLVARGYAGDNRGQLIDPC